MTEELSEEACSTLSDGVKKSTYLPSRTGLSLSGSFGVYWAIHLFKEWPRSLNFVWRLLSGFGVVLGFILSIIFADYLLARVRIPRTVRSGIWFAAFLSPQLGVIAFQKWEHQIAGLIVGAVSTVVVFVVTFLFTKQASRE